MKHVIGLICPNCGEGPLYVLESPRNFMCESCDVKIVHEGNAFVLE